MTTSITFQGIEDCINPVYMRYMVKNQNPIQIYYGGSSSGKSHAIAQRVILDTLEGRNYLIVRKTGDSLRRSTFNEVVSKIYDLQVQQYFTINKAEMLITCGLHNKQIMFKGLDDVEKLKSIKPLNGVITDIWLEEATECSYNDYKQLDKRLRGKSNFVKRITFSFNPIVRSHWIYEEFFKDRWVDGGQYVESDGVSILKTTYRDNQFLAPDDIERLESEKDPYYRMVYLDGEWGVLKGIVYDNWEIRNFDKNSFANYRIGVDWGFSDDPFACVRVAVDIKRKELWICDEIYKKGMLNDASMPLVKQLSHGSIVWCDSAEPKSIAEFRANGINAYAVKKGHGSIEQGINFIKRFRIYVHPSCKNTINELSSYRYKEDAKTGDILPEPVDKDNHICVAKGTWITTDKGDVLIENIKEGDLVLTRQGYKKVLAAGMTAKNAKVVMLETRKHKLFLTRNHKVYLVNRKDFVETKELKCSDKVLSINDKRKNFLIKLISKKFIPDNVLNITEVEKRTFVYNITVEDAHEYFANGILVKNCDALRYALERDARMRGTIKEGL